MSTLATAMLAAATVDGISPRTMTLLIASTIPGLVGGVLGFIVCDGTQNQKLATGAITGSTAFIVAYSFFDDLVVPASPFTPNPTPTRQR